MLPKDLAEILVKADPNSTVGFTGKYLYIKANINLDALAEALEEYVRPPSSLQEFQRLDELMGELAPQNYNFYDGDRIPDGVLEDLDKVVQKLKGFRLVETEKETPGNVNFQEPGITEGERRDRIRLYNENRRSEAAKRASTEIQEIVIGLTDYRAPDITENERQYRLENYSRLIRSVRPDKTSDTDIGVNVKGPEMGGRPDWVQSEPETGIKGRHVCTPDCPPITEHVHHAGCALGSPDCPEFGRKRSKPDGFFTRMWKVLNRS